MTNKIKQLTNEMKQLLNKTEEIDNNQYDELVKIMSKIETLLCWSYHYEELYSKMKKLFRTLHDMRFERQPHECYNSFWNNYEIESEYNDIEYDIRELVTAECVMCYVKVENKIIKSMNKITEIKSKSLRI